MSMTRKQAEAAIRGILAAIPDDQLPSGRIEDRDGRTIAWFGGTGYYLGSATKGGVRRPENYRETAVLDALTGEAVYRLDVQHLASEVES